MKHTPGPWFYEVEQMNGYSFNVVDDFQTQVAEVARWNEEDAPELLEQSEANAQLIAAAPEMLALLKTLLENCALINKTGLDKTRYRQAVKALINKIEGE